jgi:hypothetical protein
MHSFSKSGIFLEQSRECQNALCPEFNSSLNSLASKSSAENLIGRYFIPGEGEN